MIRVCKCKHSFQDKEYGRQQRVHNPVRGGGWRCTVCGDEKDVSKRSFTKEKP